MHSSQARSSRLAQVTLRTLAVGVLLGLGASSAAQGAGATPSQGAGEYHVSPVQRFNLASLLEFLTAYELPETDELATHYAAVSAAMTADDPARVRAAEGEVERVFASMDAGLATSIRSFIAALPIAQPIFNFPQGTMGPGGPCANPLGPVCTITCAFATFTTQCCYRREECGFYCDVNGFPTGVCSQGAASGGGTGVPALPAWGWGVLVLVLGVGVLKGARGHG